MKKLLKLTLVTAVWLSVTTANAHQPNISSVTLIEQESGEWTVQINAGILGFQYEVEAVYGTGSYSSVEEFNQLLLGHLREEISILMNEQELTLSKGIVKLGHAAAVVFELSGMPEEVNNIFIRNAGFKNVHNSQSIFSIVKEGFGRDQFILSSENDYQTEVSLKDSQVLLAESPSTRYSLFLIAIGTLIVLASLFLFAWRFKKTNITRSNIVSHA